MKVKIAYCLPSLYVAGGMERVLTSKANYFAEEMGYEVYVILTDGKDSKPYFPLSPKVHLLNLDINYNQLYNKPFLKRGFGYLYRQVIYKKRLKKALFSIRPDITVSMLRREINFINSISDGSIKIGEIHVNRANFRDFKGEKYVGPIKRILAKFWMRQLISNLKKLDHFIVLSEEDKRQWKELNRVSVINNPVSFFPSVASTCINREVIAVGRYTYEKRFNLLIDAWKIVHDKHPEWNLRIFGDGDRAPLVNQINSLHLEKSCFLEHTIQNIADKYLESSIFALSSLFEGFGIVICEAMACGVPPVSFNCPHGPKEIIKDGEDGFLVENGNVEELAQKICYLIENEDLRKEMGHRARISAERFKIGSIMNQWNELFGNLLKSKSRCVPQ